MTSPVRILLLEDNATDAELIQELLKADHFDCEATHVQTRAEFVAALENGGIDLILADYKLPSFDGLSALKLALTARPICLSSLFPARLAKKWRSKRSKSGRPTTF